MKETPVSELKLNYRKLLEIGLIISLLLHVVLFQVFKRVSVEQKFQNLTPGLIIVEDIPQIALKKQVQAPLPPTIPIPSESVDLPPEQTLEFFDDFSDYNPVLPPPPIEGDEIFVSFDKPPEPIGGFRSIQNNLVYPEIARRIGVEGRVIIKAHVDEQGNVIGTKVAKSLGPNGCDEAAILAIQSVKWHPALQRDMPVSVWVAVPVDFQLR